MEKKKIGIITILNVNNYGAELQAFALHHKLKLLGYDSEIINYLYYKNPRFRFEQQAKPLFGTSKMNKVKDLAIKWLDKYAESTNREVARTREERFKNFHLKNTALSVTYHSFSELYEAEHPYNVFIVGSDQVWNPNNGTNLEPYFLTFAPTNARKISYASSFGVGKIDRLIYPIYRKLLNNLDFIGTREETGVTLIEEITKREATRVVDPTLLLSKREWEDILVPYEENRPYILLFIFKNSSYVTELAYALQKKTGYRIIRVCKNAKRVESDEKILNLRDLGPLEFLGLYQKAAIVLTTSFHGTVFSLIFEKPFFTITPASKNNNIRQQELLRRVGLQSRLLKEGDDFPDLDDVSIDFGPVRDHLEADRNRSIAFLTNAIDS
ncbi:polysaccharide pyruvyl transferase family protein [Olivibacter sp. SDN3]|uniref:polysaccharide pyruvyl transferase family protein n=1 Tax=Olivibacter sp. SDN3 TaxID=2764720 RepID=UPI0016511F3F|nr:polysaccharide pyruvyl transferase family protein [Olivibacter sp. SDN3]QNL51634.1 polysaccharide pyruvyl transferase family protein [Olivibacter sp. SDN3]